MAEETKHRKSARQKEYTFNEAQLVQMARQEETELANKQALIEQITSLAKETILAKEALKEMKTTKGKLMVAIGASVMVEVEAKQITKCKRGFSEGGFKEEDVDDTVKWLEKREDALKKQLEELSKQAAQHETRLSDLVGVLKQIEQEKRKHAAKQPITISK